MRFYFPKSIAYFLMLFFFYSCANVKSPTGGERDTTPPQIDSSEYFTPNLSTNFKAPTIELPFNEWVVLNDVLNQVVISPPLAKPVKMTLKKKTVIIDLKEEQLRENTTYTINFGQAIKDLTEGNAPKDFRFIFSTGPFIDSLEVSGTVVNALTTLPEEDVFVILYDNLEDSVVFKERPYYFGKTDKEGRFRIPNVKQDTFKIVALRDKNLNYKFEPTSEAFGFTDTPLITGDSVRGKIKLRLFEEAPIVKAFRPYSPHFGLVLLVFNTPKIERVNLNAIDLKETYQTLIEQEKDTIRFWYNGENLDSVRLAITDNITLNDTFTVKLSTKEAFFKTNPKLTARTVRGKITQNPDRPFSLVFNRPIAQIDTGRIQLFADTTRTPLTAKISLTPNNLHELNVTAKWKENLKYQLLIPANSVTDWLGASNDTIQLELQVKPRKEFGTITVTAENLDSTQAYIIQLLNSKNEVIEEFYATNKTMASQRFVSIKPTDYKLRVVIDENRNQRWDTGKYPTRQPEKTVIGSELSTLRADWELDLKIVLE